jgi:hypothetical protein
MLTLQLMVVYTSQDTLMKSDVCEMRWVNKTLRGEQIGPRCRPFIKGETTRVDKKISRSYDLEKINGINVVMHVHGFRYYAQL